MYGKVVEVDDTYDALIRKNYARRGYTNVTDEEFQNDARLMEEMLAPFEVGDTIVYFDGYYFSIDEKPIEFDGMYASHKFDSLPHAIALQRPEYLREILGDVDYWRSRERPERLQD